MKPPSVASRKNASTPTSVVPKGPQVGVVFLGSVEEELDRARLENKRLMTANRQLARALRNAAQRGTAARHLAHHDGLTGLPNRRFLRQRLEAAICGAHRTRQRFALLFVDLDHFKLVNDGLGHTVGDKLLAMVAARILAAVRSDDIACRYGGDEFVVLLADVGDVDVIGIVAEKVRGRIERLYMVDGHSVSVGASIGFALFPAHGKSCDELLGHADASMYLQKTQRMSSVPSKKRPALRRSIQPQNHDPDRALA